MVSLRREDFANNFRAVAEDFQKKSEIFDKKRYGFREDMTFTHLLDRKVFEQ